MTGWWIDRVLPGFASTSVVAVAGYVKLHFEKRWPYWGRKHGEGK